MPRLPPLEKLPLAARKNLRDNWQDKQADFEKQLSEAMGVDWTIDIDALAIVPYEDNPKSWVRESPGSMVATYVKDAIRHLKGNPDYHDEINKLAPSHVLTMDLDEEGIFDSCGAKFQDGKLAIVFKEGRLGYNTSEAFFKKNLEKGIDLAPTPTGETLSFYARQDIQSEYDPRAEEIQSQIGAILGKGDFKIVPNFEETYQKLKASEDAPKDFEKNIGQFVRLYFEALVHDLKSQKFDSDDMMQEALNEAVEKGEAHFRVVDAIKTSYCECAIEDGILYLQTFPGRYGVNIDQVGKNLTDLL